MEARFLALGAPIPAKDGALMGFIFPIELLKEVFTLTMFLLRDWDLAIELSGVSSGVKEDLFTLKAGLLGFQYFII